MKHEAARGHPNDLEEVKRKLANDALAMSDSEREDLRRMLDSALTRTADEPTCERADRARKRAAALCDEAAAVHAQAKQAQTRNTKLRQALEGFETDDG